MLQKKQTAVCMNKCIFFLLCICERWTGARVKPQEAEEISGISDIRFVDAFERDFKALAVSGRYEKLYLEMSVLSMTD